MEKLEVKICTGTLCYVMGGSELQLLDEYLPKEILDRIEIKGASCLGYCNSGASHNAPYVNVGDTTVSEATLSKVMEVIMEKLGQE